MDIASLTEKDGEPVVLRRKTAANPPAFTSVVVQAVVRPFGAHELVGNIKQGDYKIIVAVSTLTAAGFPGPSQRGDMAVINPTIAAGAWVKGTGQQLSVEDPGARGGAGFWIQARG